MKKVGEWFDDAKKVAVPIYACLATLLYGSYRLGSFLTTYEDYTLNGSPFGKQQAQKTEESLTAMQSQINGLNANKALQEQRIKFLEDRWLEERKK